MVGKVPCIILSIAWIRSAIGDDCGTVIDDFPLIEAEIGPKGSFIVNNSYANAGLFDNVFINPYKNPVS